MVTSDLSKLTQQVEVERALVSAGIAVDNNLGLNGTEDTQTVRSNTDEKVTVFSALDGEPRRILRIDARRILSKRLPDGRPAFWIPELGGTAPVRQRGAVRCYLDPEFDESALEGGVDRKWIDSIGLAGRRCNMSAPDRGIPKFMSAYDRDEHASKKHRREYATIQAARERERREREDRAARESREAMMALARSAVARGPGRPPKTD